MQKNGIIFGKFYPLHTGHVNFIQIASGYVENLYVVVCTDDDRDKKLYEESKMKKMPTVKDRIRFVEKTFKHQKNIKIIHLAEDGIPFYPNGWKLWSERVQEALLKNKIKVDVIFTNETQDVENYKNSLGGNNNANTGNKRNYTGNTEKKGFDKHNDYKPDYSKGFDDWN